MLNLKKIAAALVVISIAGCVQQQSAYRPSTSFADLNPRVVDVKDDQFEKKMTFSGFKEGSHIENHFIRSWLDKGDGSVAHQIYIVDKYLNDWRFWNGARDDTAKELEFVSIDRSVDSCLNRVGCFHTEQFGVAVSDASLRERRSTGYRIKAVSKAGIERIIYVSPQQIAAQLDAIDARKPAPQPAPAAVPTTEKAPEAKPVKKKK